MCDKHPHGPRKLPRGSSLEHGKAHSNDHSWNRRSFLSTMGLATVGSTFVLAGRPVHALANSPLVSRLSANATDRILVLVQLEGGNDGLNTIIPITNDIYYQERPNLSIPANQALTLDADHGLHPSLTTFRDLYDDGKLAIVQNVGYDNANLSHFRSTDIWMSASDENTVVDNGWIGRYLDETNPGFATNQPDEPLAVQVGGSGLIFKGSPLDMGMSVRDLSRFDALVNDGNYYTMDGLPATAYGAEMGFMRTTANSALRYGTAIQEAASRSTTTATYPDDELGNGLAAIARLINGDLSTSIYVVTLGGFDTHALQTDEHASLFDSLSTSVAAFLSDIVDPVDRDRIVLATFSEFGRRIEENGSQGTDHGTAAPMFVFGNRVNGGLYGEGADLGNPDEDGNMRHSTDYRQVYATLLEDWLGASSDLSSDVLLRSFATLPLISNSNVAVEGAESSDAFGLSANYPNPFTDRTSIGYTMDQPGHVRIDLFDIRGRLVRTLHNGATSAGKHQVEMDGTGLAAGNYVARMQSGEQISTTKLLRVR